MPLLLSVSSILGVCRSLPVFVCGTSSSLEVERLSIKYPVISSSLLNAPALLSTIADEYSGVRAPETGLESVDLRLVASPYIETERRSDDRRGKRDWTADGSMEYSIEASIVCGAKSAESGRLRRVAGRSLCLVCAMSAICCEEEGKRGTEDIFGRFAREFRGWESEYKELEEQREAICKTL